MHAQQARESTRATCTRSKQGKKRCSQIGGRRCCLAGRRAVRPVTEEEHKQLVWSVQSSSSGVVLMCMAKVGCAGPLHAAVCISTPQCLEPLPPPPIVRVATQDHPVHLLAATQHGCAQSKQKHESAKVRCVSPLCAVASRSAARAIPICPPLCRCCAIFLLLLRLTMKEKTKN